MPESMPDDVCPPQLEITVQESHSMKLDGATDSNPPGGSKTRQWLSQIAVAVTLALIIPVATVFTLNLNTPIVDKTFLPSLKESWLLVFKLMAMEPMAAFAALAVFALIAITLSTTLYSKDISNSSISIYETRNSLLKVTGISGNLIVITQLSYLIFYSNSAQNTSQPPSTAASMVAIIACFMTTLMTVNRQNQESLDRRLQIRDINRITDLNKTATSRWPSNWKHPAGLPEWRSTPSQLMELKRLLPSMVFFLIVVIALSYLLTMWALYDYKLGGYEKNLIFSLCVTLTIVSSASPMTAAILTSVIAVRSDLGKFRAYIVTSLSLIILIYTMLPMMIFWRENIIVELLPIFLIPTILTLIHLLMLFLSMTNRCFIRDAKAFNSSLYSIQQMAQVSASIYENFRRKAADNRIRSLEESGSSESRV